MLLDKDVTNDRGDGSSCEIGQAREKFELELWCRCEKCDVRSVEEDVSSRELPVTSSGLFLCWWLEVYLPPSRLPESPPWSPQKALLPLPCSWGWEQDQPWHGTTGQTGWLDSMEPHWGLEQELRSCVKAFTLALGPHMSDIVDPDLWSDFSAWPQTCLIAMDVSRAIRLHLTLVTARGCALLSSLQHCGAGSPLPCPSCCPASPLTPNSPAFAVPRCRRRESAWGRFRVRRGAQGRLTGCALVSLAMPQLSWSTTTSLNISKVSRRKKEQAKKAGSASIKTNVFWKLDTDFLPPKQPASWKAC